MSPTGLLSASSEPRSAPGGSLPPTVAPPVEARVYRQLFDRESLSDYLKISTDTIERLVKAGKLQCVRIGSQVRFTFEDVEAFIDRPRARKPSGTARIRQPVKGPATRLWRARYVDLEGVVRQAGSFERKGDAISHTAALVGKLNSEGPAASGVPTLEEFLDEGPHRFPRHPRTQATNTERIPPVHPAVPAERWRHEAR